MVGFAAGRDFVEGRPRAAAVGRLALFAVAVHQLAVGPVLAHSGHAAGHDGGGSILVPGSILLGSLLVIGAGAYLDHTDGVDGRLARLAVLFGVGGVLLGILAAV
jgi:hypothetical protein